MKTITVTLLVFLSFIVNAQEELPQIKFGEIDIENLKMEVYPADSSASAVVLYDKGHLTIGNSLKIVLKRHTRIKILNPDALELGNIKIRHFKDDFVLSIFAATYNLENGETTVDKIDRESIIRIRENRDFSVTSFPMPAVKKGSIIEFTYEIVYESIRRILPWQFQYTIPVKYSEYTVVLPEAFIYRPRLTGYVDVFVKDEGYESIFVNRNDNPNSRLQGKDLNAYFKMRFSEPVSAEDYAMQISGKSLPAKKATYVAQDVPAFHIEPNLASVDDYITQLSFELFAVSIPGVLHHEYMYSDYLDMSSEMKEWSPYSNDLNRSKFVRDQVEEIVNGIDSDLEKAKAIYDWMQRNFSVSSYEEMSWSRIFERQKGVPSQINFLLILMMKEAGIKSEPVMISTRSHGTVSESFVSFYNFNRLLCLVTDDGNEYILDASDKYVPFNSLGVACLNGNGLVLSEKNPRWIELKNSGLNREISIGDFILSSEGTLNGKITKQRTGLIAAMFRSRHTDAIDEYKDRFAEERSAWQINTHQLDKLENSGGPLTETIEMTTPDYGEGDNGIIYLEPLIMNMLKENPYKLDFRQYPVDYSFPSSTLISCNIEIPEGYSVEEHPEPVALVLPDNAARFSYNVSVNGNRVTVTAQLNIKQIQYPTDQYQSIKSFYDSVIGKLREQLVLKKSI